VDTGENNGRGSEDQSPLPWHPPQVPDAELGSDLPPSVADAARRAFDARRPNTCVADLVDEQLIRAEGTTRRILRFVCDRTELALQVGPAANRLRLQLHLQPPGPAEVEVLHAGQTLRSRLDASGRGEVDGVEPGLLSVIVRVADGTPDTQTSWVRVTRLD
jgi:hypothetical protein